MADETWLLYGARGWIASHFLQYIPAGVTVVPAAARCDDAAAVAAELDAVRPLVVVTVAGRTSGPGFSSIDYLEQPGRLSENVRDNLFSVVILHQACRERGIFFAYLGTGCIFSYAHTGYNEPIFHEDDKPNFFGSSYSVVKGFTDRYMHDVATDALNIRIRMPITAEHSPKSLVDKILHYPRVCSTLNSMSVLPDLMPVMADLIRRRVAGTYHLVNPGALEHNDILGMYRDIVDPAYTWVNFSEEEQAKVIVSQRSKNVLSTSRLEADYPQVPCLRDSLVRIFTAWREGQ